jgi:histidinol-phosphatase (PHP family)
MAGPADYHMHTPLCRHATGEPTLYAAHALKIGLTEIGFSDHSPMRQDSFDDWRMRFDQLDRYVEGVHQAQRDHPALTIKLSLEVDYLPNHEDWIRELAARHPWDYLIGSVHYVSDSWVVDNPQQLAEWKHHDPFDVWSAYFERLNQAAESGLFDIIGHADLPKKFGLVPRQDCTPLFQRFLQTAQRKGLAVELNTAGLRKDCREIYPSEPFCRLMHQHQIPITFGSDAHAPAEVGLNWSEALDLARRSGFTHWLRFTQRHAEPVDL